MSGIGGIFDRGGAPVTEIELLPTLERLAHRGPDARRTCARGDTAFAHLLLETTPQCRARALPLIDPDSGLMITCDARLDDRLALAGRLGLKLDLAQTSDAELLLASYQKWGQDCARHLLGDFAFVIRDPDRDQVFCARDFIGARPFYYTAEAGRFTFASELRGVAAALAGSRPNPIRMADLLLDYESADAEITFDERIRRLPAGCTLVVTRRSLETRRYWSAAAIAQQPWTDARAREALGNLLQQSVADRHRSTRTPTVALSGGLDSAVVLAASARLGEGCAVSAVQDDPSCRDTQCSRLVRSAVAAEGPEVSLAELADRDRQISGLLEDLDDPFSFADTLAMLLYTRARQAGHRVILDGVEGDLVYSLPGDLAPTLMRSGKLREGARLLRGQGASAGEIARRIAASRVPPRMLEARRAHHRRLEVASALDASPLALMGPKRTLLVERYMQHLARRSRAFDDPSALHAAWIDLPFITSALERYDRAAALCGVEVRHPLLDKRLVEFALSLPWQLKWRDGQSKWLLRQTADELPQEVQQRQDHPHLGWTYATAWAATNWDRLRLEIRRREALWSRYLRKAPVIQSLAVDSYNGDSALPLQLHFLAQWLEKSR